jgi:hypothetical protein
MRLKDKLRNVSALVSLLMSTASAYGTSITVQISGTQILFVADTHEQLLSPGTQTSNDDFCKIVPLGHAAAAFIGNVHYTPNGVLDLIPSWDTQVDAREAYTSTSRDLRKTASEWAEKAKNHYSSLYLAVPELVTQLAKGNTANILLAGLFAGYRDGKAMLFMQVVSLDETHSLAPIVNQEIVFGPGDLTYPAHPITQELMEGNSERAKSSQAEWTRKAKSISMSEQRWRRLEYFIQETAKYDKSVGTRVNVLEISLDADQRWLQNSTCPAVSQKP